MRIVFWGGCINHQKNLALTKHYHALVTNLVEEATGKIPEVHLEFYSSYSELKTKSEQLLSDGTYDYFIVFIRPFPIVPLTKLFVRYRDKQARHRLLFHPKYSNKKYYDLMLEENKIIHHSGKRKGFLHRMLKEFNNYAADKLHLGQWACREILNTLQQIAQITEVKNVRLILAGPPSYLHDPRTHEVCLDVARNIKANTTLNDNRYADISCMENESGETFFENDQIHLTEAGHAYLASEIFKLMLR